MQLTMSIYAYNESNKFTIEVIPYKIMIEGTKIEKDILIKTECNEKYEQLCEGINISINSKTKLLNTCSNIIFDYSPVMIVLLSATYVRSSKYNDEATKRISYEDTCLGNIIYEYDKTEIEAVLKFLNLKMLKFSSYTQTSELVEAIKNKMVM